VKAIGARAIEAVVFGAIVTVGAGVEDDIGAGFGLATEGATTGVTGLAVATIVGRLLLVPEPPPPQAARPKAKSRLAGTIRGFGRSCFIEEIFLRKRTCKGEGPFAKGFNEAILRLLGYKGKRVVQGSLVPLKDGISRSYF